jgi:23S rRNA (cytosine1962-C5)-methyltransferase
VQADFAASDVFDYFEKCISERKFDIIIIDPPAFAKSRKSIPTALKGYTKLNKLALCIKGRLSGYLIMFLSYKGGRIFNRLS